MRRGPDEGRVGIALAFVAALLPVLLAAFHLLTIGDTSHDRAAIAALGLGFTGGFRALDAALAAPFVLLPLGTRALRASMASAFCLALVALVHNDLARSRLSRAATKLSGLAAFAALVATALVSLAPAVQVESIAIGGATLPLLLALLPRALVLRNHSVERVALVLGAAFAYEPLVGLCALASIAPLVSPKRPELRVALAFAAGFLPLIASIASRSLRSAEANVLSHPFGDGWGAHGSPLAVITSELGVVAVGLAVGGLALLIARPACRRDALSSIAVLVVSATCMAIGCAVGPTCWSPLALVAFSEVALLTATGMFAALSFVRDTRVPFAKASAWLAGVIFVAIPARQADDTSYRMAKNTGNPERAFASAAWDSLPLGALALVADQEIATHIASARAQGDVRADVAFVRLGRASTVTDIVREPKLAPLLRDQALYGAPEEWSLSALASARPIVLTFDARWPRPLSRHLIAVGLFDRFFPEPRGLVDRRAALEANEPPRLALAVALGNSPDPDLAHVTATLLRARLLGAAATGDRDVIGRALDDLRPFAPGDPTAFEIVRRTTLTRGPLELDDLDHEIIH